MSEESKYKKIYNFFAKNKQTLYGFVLVVIGVFGGNIDRISSIVTTVKEEYPQLKEDIKSLQKTLQEIKEKLDKEESVPQL